VAAIAARPIPVRVEPGAREMNITIRADRGLYISGKLVDERGAPARREFIYCRGAPGNDWGGRQLYTVKADGTFRCGPLVSGEYLLSADRRNNATDIQDRDSVLAIAGTTDARVVVFANSRVLISLTNSAVESESVDLKLIMKEPLFGVDAQSRKATGSEETIFDALEPGRYAIVASTDSGMFAVEPFFDLGKNETKTCTLQLEPGGQVKVHFKKSKNLDDYGMLSVLKNDIPIVSHFNDGDESAKTIKVPAGSLRLESYGGGAEWTKEVFVTPGQAIYVEIP
ncbi:MAG: hypothetical protein ACKVS6_07200, partial [Planctomycetota bacterium]